MPDKATQQFLLDYWKSDVGPFKAVNSQKLPDEQIADENIVLRDILDTKAKRDRFKEATLWLLNAYSTKANAKRLWPSNFQSQTAKDFSKFLIP